MNKYTAHLSTLLKLISTYHLPTIFINKSTSAKIVQNISRNFTASVSLRMRAVYAPDLGKKKERKRRNPHILTLAMPLVRAGHDPFSRYRRLPPLRTCAQ